MTAAARVAPKDYFSTEEWAPLARKSAWKGPALIAHAWLVILAAAAMAMAFPITIPLAVMIIGARQLGLAILMHDAAHGALHPDLKVNDWLGEHLTPGGLGQYRSYHLGHHKFAQQAEDPDLGLSAPFPITALSLRRKILRDLTGQTHFKQRWAPLLAPVLHRRCRDHRGHSAVRLLVGVVRAVVATLSHLAAAGHAPQEHRRTRLHREGRAGSAASRAHHPGQPDRADVPRALLCELSLRASHVHACALLQSAPNAPPAEGEGGYGGHADSAELSRCAAPGFEQAGQGRSGRWSDA
jgi:hypothetical protein